MIRFKCGRHKFVKAKNEGEAKKLAKGSFQKSTIESILNWTNRNELD